MATPAEPDETAGIAQCRREIADIEDQLRSAHPDIHGLLLALVDWSGELRILLAEQEKPPNPMAAR